MTPEELIGGLRERGYSIVRMRYPPIVLIPRVKADDPLLPWLRDDLQVGMAEYRPEAWSHKDGYAYEARLHTANIPFDGDVGARALAIWQAAAGSEEMT